MESGTRTGRAAGPRGVGGCGGQPNLHWPTGGRVTVTVLCYLIKNRSKENGCKFLFQLTSNYINKVYIICKSFYIIVLINININY